MCGGGGGVVASVAAVEGEVMDGISIRVAIQILSIIVDLVWLPSSAELVLFVELGIRRWKVTVGSPRSTRANKLPASSTVNANRVVADH